MAGELKSLWRVWAWHAKLGNLGNFDQSTGGAGDSAEKKYREGGARDKSVLGGSRERTNVKIERLWREERDGPIYKPLDNSRGVDDLKIYKQAVDGDYNDIGEPIIYNGKVKMVESPDTDSDDDATETKLVIEQTTATSIG